MNKIFIILFSLIPQSFRKHPYFFYNINNFKLIYNKINNIFFSYKYKFNENNFVVFCLQLLFKTVFLYVCILFDGDDFRKCLLNFHMEELYIKNFTIKIKHNTNVIFIERNAIPITRIVFFTITIDKSFENEKVAANIYIDCSFNLKIHLSSIF